MKHLYIYFLLFGLVVSVRSVQSQENNRPKVGVVLSGGGAKGIAHVAVLKVIEEAGIPIDYIAGTSMGALVGGLYAIGYTPIQLDSIVHRLDWSYFLGDDIYRTDKDISERESPEYLLSIPYNLDFKNNPPNLKIPMGVIAGQNIYNVLMNLTIGYHQDLDFNKLPIPFACVATNLREGEEKVFREGSLATAMRASMAIPGIFAPVEHDSTILIDGGILNNYPVDVIKEMGADIVIGVELSKDKRYADKSKGSLTEVIMRIFNYVSKNKKQKNYESTDVMITPMLYPYGMLSFDKGSLDSILQRGEKATRDKWDDLIALKKEKGLNDINYNETRPHKNNNLEGDTLKINNVKSEGLSYELERYTLRRIKINKTVTREELDRIVSRFYGTGYFSKVYYKMTPNSPHDLTFIFEQRNDYRLNLGLRFDTREKAAALINTAIRLSKSFSVFDLTARLSQHPYVKFNYIFDYGSLINGSLKYEFRTNNIDLYKKDIYPDNFSYTQNTAIVNFSEAYFKNIRLHLGTDFDFIKTKITPWGNDPENIESKRSFYASYFFEGGFDNLDKSDFPTEGGYFSFRYSIVTDNFSRMNNSNPPHISEFMFLKPIRFNDKIVVSSKISGRSILNRQNNTPIIYRNFIGGIFSKYNLVQQQTVAGITKTYMVNDTFVSAEESLRYTIANKNHFTASLNFAIESGKPLTLLQGKKYLGGNIEYAYTTLVGPLFVGAGYSSLSRNFDFYAGLGFNF